MSDIIDEGYDIFSECGIGTLSMHNSTQKYTLPFQCLFSENIGSFDKVVSTFKNTVLQVIELRDTLR